MTAGETRVTACTFPDEDEDELEIPENEYDDEDCHWRHDCCCPYCGYCHHPDEPHQCPMDPPCEKEEEEEEEPPAATRRHWLATHVPDCGEGTLLPVHVHPSHGGCCLCDGHNPGDEPETVVIESISSGLRLFDDAGRLARAYPPVNVALDRHYWLDADAGSAALDDMAMTWMTTNANEAAEWRTNLLTSMRLCIVPDYDRNGAITLGERIRRRDGEAISYYARTNLYHAIGLHRHGGVPGTYKAGVKGAPGAFKLRAVGTATSPGEAATWPAAESVATLECLLPGEGEITYRLKDGRDQWHNALKLPFTALPFLIDPRAAAALWTVDTNVTLTIPGGFVKEDTVVWSSPPPGLRVTSSIFSTNLTFNPSLSAPGSYTVSVRSSLYPTVQDAAMAHVVKVTPATPVPPNATRHLPGDSEIRLAHDNHWAQNVGSNILWTVDRKGLSYPAKQLAGTFLFTPGDSTAGVYTVTATAEILPAATTDFTLTVTWVDIEPDGTNACTATPGDIEIPLTKESYHDPYDDDILWSCDDPGLSLVITNGSFCTFTPTNSLPGEYTLTAMSRIHTNNAQDTCTVRIYGIGSLGGTLVYDPRLDGAGDALFTCEVMGSATLAPKLEMAVSNATHGVVATPFPKASAPVGTEAAAWDGRWGAAPHAGKYADPGEYALVARLYDEDDNCLGEKAFTFHVVRLGVESIEFTGRSFGDRIPLTYHQTRSKDDNNDGISAVTNRFPVPSIAWRIADTNGAFNVDKVTGADAGEARQEEPPWTETFHPQVAETNSWNYPVCYRMGKEIMFNVRTSSAGWSQVTSNALDSASLGYKIPGTGTDAIKVNLYATRNGAPMPAWVVGGHADITPGKEILMYSTNALPNSVGKSVETVTWTWKYETNKVEVAIPGSYTTTHTVYRVLEMPQLPWNILLPALRPWVATLDYATTWANGAKTPEEAATMITAVVNKKKSEGGLGLEYDIANGAPNYTASLSPSTNTTLRLANFLRFLEGV
ncbi:MAG: hypothetical protein FWF84_05925, partial [Kiritimatiellaeota bacterium]|nr:hypothetical protein [Kiritimatiellota bacterium]